MLSKPISKVSKRVSSGLTPLRSNPDFWKNGTIPWLKTEQLGEKYIYETSEKISAQALRKTSIKVCPENTLSIAMYGEGKTRGNVSIIKSEMTTNQACCNVELDPELVDYEYVYYFLKTQYDQLRNLSSGVRKNLNSNDIKNFVIRLPKELSEQKKIAAVLSALDAKIACNNRINAELEAMAKTLYDYWFVQFDFPYDFAQGRPDPNGKPYRTAGGKMVCNPTLKREIPEGWTDCELGDHLTFKRGISYKSSDIQATGIPFINLNSFSLSGEFKHGGTKFYNGNYNQNALLKAGDLVIAITDVTRNADIIGKAFVLTDIFDQQPLISCDVAAIFSKTFGSFYLERLFNSSTYHSYIKHFASGTLVLHLDLNGVNWFKSVLPPPELLEQYELLCFSLLKRRSLTLKENIQLKTLRDWLLPMLMNGQVTVT
ncbi:MAG: restriction endonuclease subunit S [Gallionella sp.]|nr:restriction endonuclease subunit S [Gallionella sp.]